MSRDHLCLVRQRQQAGVNRVDDLIVVTAWQVGSPDAAGKERVPGNQQLERRKVEADGALRVAGRVQDLRRISGKSHSHAVGKALVGRRGLRRLYPQPIGLLLHECELLQVAFVQVDGCAG